MKTIKQKYQDMLENKIKESHKFIMGSLVDNKSNLDACLKAQLISYTVCSTVIGCSKGRFYKITGVNIYNNRKTLTSLDNILVKKYQKELL
jgi:hypothetical protein